jgi:hypothetical protein
MSLLGSIKKEGSQSDPSFFEKLELETYASLEGSACGAITLAVKWNYRIAIKQCILVDADFDTRLQSKGSLIAC